MKPETCSHCKYFSAIADLWACEKDGHTLSTNRPNVEVDKHCRLKAKGGQPMKKIIISVEVPDDFNENWPLATAEDFTDGGIRLDFELLHRPTDEEIKDIAVSSVSEAPLYNEGRYVTDAIKIALGKAINQIFGEEAHND